MSSGSDAFDSVPGEPGDGSDFTTGGRISIPSWIFNPRRKILGIVAGWIVGGILIGGRQVLGAILLAFDVVGGALVDAIDAVGLGFAAVGEAILGVATTIHVAIVDTVAGLGPFAFPALIVVYAGIVIGLLAVGRWLVELVDVPVINLGALVDAATWPFRAVWGWLRG